VYRLELRKGATRTRFSFVTDLGGFATLQIARDTLAKTTRWISHSLSTWRVKQLRTLNRAASVAAVAAIDVRVSRAGVGRH